VCEVAPLPSSTSTHNEILRQAYAGDTVRILRMQRAIVDDVMRGQVAPNAG